MTSTEIIPRELKRKYQFRDQTLDLTIIDDQDSSITNIHHSEESSKSTFALDTRYRTNQKDDQYEILLATKDIENLKVNFKEDSNLIVITTFYASSPIRLSNLSISEIDGKLVNYQGKYQDKKGNIAKFSANTDPLPLLYVVGAIAAGVTHKHFKDYNNCIKKYANTKYKPKYNYTKVPYKCVRGRIRR
jgi:hypothetical protein